MSWSRRPTGFIDEAEGELNKRLRGTALGALAGVIDRSPVDEGRFRGNNMVTVSEPTDEYDESLIDPNGQATLAAGDAIIGRITSAFEVIYIQNNLPYAEPLENGHSDQAPAGVYEVTFNSIRELGQ